MQHCSLNSIYESNISHLGIFWLEMSYILKFQQCLGKKHNQMSELYISVLIMRENMLISRGIYTAGKKITLPPVVTNLTSVCYLSHIICDLITTLVLHSKSEGFTGGREN